MTLGEGEDYITWSGSKINKYTADISCSFHYFMICVEWFQRKKKGTKNAP